MKESLLSIYDVPITEKEEDVKIEAEVRDTMPQREEAKVKQDPIKIQLQTLSKEELEKNVKQGDDVLKSIKM